MNGKVPPDPEPLTRTEVEGETLDMPEGVRGFVPGQVLGERYQIVEMLGRGGMGEVWHAFDLKLRVEVALKALRPEFFKSERRLELLRQEVRAAREVVSPNVCRIFDLIEVEGRELVSMEYVDGATLLGVLQERGPLELKEAQDIASQFLAGLEAIHKAGLIHRDIKPENIMLTRAGRVVVMDFGLARQETEGGGSVSGTPAYMAPEQAAGQTLDARADVYAAGVVLAEMVSPDGIKSFESRQSLWEGVRSEPAKLPDSPWAPVIQKAVKKDREGRYHSAHTLTRALEDVTLRVEGAEDLHPYPGLASFTESDAEYFFGREAEVEQMWRKLEGPARMLALVGPSGAGKSSFLRAGLIPAATISWATTICTPGTNPVLGLSRALAASLAGDSEAVDLLLRFDDPATAIEVVIRWRHSTGRAVLIVDQFEELFTQNGAEVQQRFTELLERLVLEADTHVLLSMRDDFLFRCHEHDALKPVFSELSPIGPPAGAALRRALTQPALQCGYRFEDDELVDEMLDEVEGERGALPLLAFAAARLWEKRDRDTGLLSRQAYHDIGGVGGALARHAEATIDRIGVERIPIVRELFRNLVTAEGTRAVREWNELLSIFSDSRSESPEEVLRQLIDARLLTSYEIREADEAPTRRVEIIHESLLANWPRLVRWQTQDQEGAQLRDELRQSARAWDEHERHDDRLWTGTAFREYQLWRERYRGGLTEVEEGFAKAMTSLAGRRRRRRRLVVAAVFAILLAGLAIVGSFWQRSVREARRAEAQKLIALGQLQIDDNPSATVAHAVASLELADSDQARLLALEALWKGPTAFVVHEDAAFRPWFSADGAFIVHSAFNTKDEVRIIWADGRTEFLENGRGAMRKFTIPSPGSDVIVILHPPSQNAPFGMTLWSVADRRLIAEALHSGERWPFWGWSIGKGRVLLGVWENDRAFVDALSFDGSRERFGAIDVDPRSHLVRLNQATGRRLATVMGNEVWVRDIGEHNLSEPRVLGRHEGTGIRLAFDPLDRFVATSDQQGEIRLWDPDGASPPTILEGPPGIAELKFTGDGSLLEAFYVDEHEKVWVWSTGGREPILLRRFDLLSDAWEPAAWYEIDPARGHLARTDWDRKIRLWSFSAPADAEPLIVGRDEVGQLWPPSFDPQGRWLATGSTSGLTLYPLGRPYPSVMRHEIDVVGKVAFAPDGSWLASLGGLEDVKIWPLEGEVPSPGRVFFAQKDLSSMAISPGGTHILVGTQKQKGGDLLLPLDGGPPRELTGFRHQTSAVAFSPDGRLAAGAGGTMREDENLIRVWDVATGKELKVLTPEADLFEWALQFTADNHLLSSGRDGLRRWDLETGESELLFSGQVREFSASADGRRVLLVEASGEWTSSGDPGGVAMMLDLETGAATALDSHGESVWSVAIDAHGTIAVTGDHDGTIRVGPTSGEEPHLLLGHESSVFSVALDPLGRWIASGGGDSTVRLWPMPDLSKPPLHTLPHDELIAKLKTLTNLRIVRDEESSTGWKLEAGPFPGWAEVPEW